MLRRTSSYTIWWARWNRKLDLGVDFCQDEKVVLQTWRLITRVYFHMRWKDSSTIKHRIRHPCWFLSKREKSAFQNFVVLFTLRFLVTLPHTHVCNFLTLQKDEKKSWTSTQDFEIDYLWRHMWKNFDLVIFFMWKVFLSVQFHLKNVRLTGETSAKTFRQKYRHVKSLVFSCGKRGKLFVKGKNWGQKYIEILI